MKILKISFLFFILVFAGCAQRGVQEVDASSTKYVLNYETGTIESIKPVVIKDNGTGTFIGGLVGMVVGSTVGRGNGSALAALAGGLGGAYVGNQIGKANAQELTVMLDSGNRSVVVIVKGKKHYVGEHVRIVKRGGRVSSVEAY
ncbi:MAG: glycine zipper 2TM domain-containing protein [Sulfurospirillum sp.]